MTSDTNMHGNTPSQATPSNRFDPLDPLRPLREFVVSVTRCVERTANEAELLRSVRPLLQALISDDRWLPEAFSQAESGSYRQYLLYCDPLERFSVVSFVWGPGARTPVHDHTVWGLVGMMRGVERCMEYRPEGSEKVVACGVEHDLRPGMIEAVSPTVGDWHVVSNALPDQTSVSIHVYGANIGAVQRHMLDASTGEVRDFISGYSPGGLPNLWDRAPALKAALAGAATR
jgi:predicted metal-dependent enzyme (double-stranded beta helix superfamily)